MTTAADLVMKVRRALHDHPKRRTDTGLGDDTMTVFDLGKDLGVVSNSETVTVGGVLKVSGTDYDIDYEANDLEFYVAPAAAAAIRVTYREVRWRDETILDALNAGRRMLWMRHYQSGSATIVTRNLVRQYDLRSADVVETAMRTVFTSGQYRILRAEYLPVGASDEMQVPFQSYELNRPYVHLWRMLPVGYTLRLHLIYDFVPLVALTDVSDIPDNLTDLVTSWAIGMLGLQKEIERDRHDTANVLQGVNALPPGLQAATSDDFIKRWTIARNSIAASPPVFVEQHRPRPWQV